MDFSQKVYMLYLTGMQDGRSPFIDLRPVLVITMSGLIFDQIYIREAWALKGVFSFGILTFGILYAKINSYVRLILITLGAVILSNQLDLLYRDFYIRIFHFGRPWEAEVSGADLWFLFAVFILLPGTFIYRRFARR